MLPLKSITPGAADRLFAKLKKRASGGDRVRTALLSMTVCKRAWNVAKRDKPMLVPSLNPFHKMELEYRPKPTRAVTHAELLRFVKEADAGGESSIGTAAMIAYYWLQREQDILTRRLRRGDLPSADANGGRPAGHRKFDGSGQP